MAPVNDASGAGVICSLSTSITGSAEAGTRVENGVMCTLPTSESVASGNRMKNGVTCFGSRRCEILSKLPSVPIGFWSFAISVAFTET